MEGNKYLLLLLLVTQVYVVHTQWTCPSIPGCNCKDKDFHCYKANFTAIPNNIHREIKELRLENGNIERIETDKLAQLEMLVELNLKYNNISEIQEGAFDRLQSLKEISLKSNNLVKLKRGIFSKLKLLTKLELSDNMLTSLEGVFDGLTSLELLILNNNNVHVVTTETFQDLPNLSHLEFQSNQLHNIPQDTFLHNKKIKFMELGSNPITSFDDVLVNDTHLHYLSMAACNLSTFPQGLPVSLKHLKLNKNNIVQIKKADLERNVHLKTIILEENNLELIEKGAFLPLKQLQNIFLFVNNLNKIPGPFPQSLNNIFLDNNNIYSIHPDSFENGTELNILSLRTNNIAMLSTESFQNVKSVHELHLESNPFLTLDNHVFLLVSGLQMLTLNRLNLAIMFPECFLGLDSLKKLEMSYVKIQPESILGNVFKNTPSLQELELQDSPELAQYILTNKDVLKSLKNLTKINLKDNELTTLDSTFMNSLPNLEEISLGGNKFHCDSRLLWLRQRHAIEPQKFSKFSSVRCHMPRHLQGQRIDQININEFSETSDTQTADAIMHHTMETTVNPIYTTIDDYDYYDKYYSTFYDITVTEPTNLPSVVTPNDSTTKAELLNSEVISEKEEGILTKDQISNHKNSKYSFNFKAAGIAIGMSFAVIFIMLLVAAIFYIFYNRRRNIVYHNARQYQPKEDYVFIVSQTDAVVEPKKHRKLTREERGSTTSRASEDITNQSDLMKVYTLDVDA